MIVIMGSGRYMTAVSGVLLLAIREKRYPLAVVSCFHHSHISLSY